MRPLAFLTQLLIASVIASATAGILVLFFCMGGVAASKGGISTWAGVLFAAVFSLFAGGVAIFPAVTFLTVPTLLVGGIHCLLARRHAWLRRRSSFAATGALLGAFSYAALIPTGLMSMFDDPAPLGLSRPWAILIFLLAGACSGLVFRSSLKWISSFYGNDLWTEGEHPPEGTLP